MRLVRAPDHDLDDGNVACPESGAGQSSEVSSYAAGEQAARAALRNIRHPALSRVTVCASSHHEVDEVLRGVRAVTGETPIVSTKLEQEATQGPHARSVVVVAMAAATAVLDGESVRRVASASNHRIAIRSA